MTASLGFEPGPHWWEASCLMRHPSSPSTSFPGSLSLCLHLRQRRQRERDPGNEVGSPYELKPTLSRQTEHAQSTGIIRRVHPISDVVPAKALCNHFCTIPAIEALVPQHLTQLSFRFVFFIIVSLVSLLAIAIWANFVSVTDVAKTGETL